MSDSPIRPISVQDFDLWDKMKAKGAIINFDLELTARCNNNCRHCYINLPAADKGAERRELSFNAIRRITDEAVSLGAMWCTITGGEPLLRKDFPDIYLYLKKKGLLVSICTNATLLTPAHVRLFKIYPPRDIEVTVYGVTAKTYEQVTRKTGSHAAFMQGLNLLMENGIGVRLKAMALRSNFHEMEEIARFCRGKTKDYFRFDPFLHFRYDHNADRNREIAAERLSPKEIVALERSDSERYNALENRCDRLIVQDFADDTRYDLFFCGAGKNSFSVSYDGFFRLCASLCHPDCIYDLTTGTLTEAWRHFVPKIRKARSQRKVYLEKCARCPIINLCSWCPATAYLESGEMDLPLDFFCKIAHARAQMLKES